MNRGAISSRCWTASPYKDTHLHYPADNFLTLEVIDAAFYDVLPVNSAWKVTIEGDAMTSLRDLKGSRRWDGSVTLPLTVAPPGELDAEEQMLEAFRRGSG